MTTFDEVVPVGAGREYRFRDILGAGWRQFRANWGRAIGFSALLLLLGLVAGTVCAFAGMFLAIALTFVAVMTGVLFDSDPCVIAIGVIPMVSALAGTVFSFMLLSQGFLWSVVVSFPADRLRWGRIFDFLYHARFWRMVGYGSLLTLSWFLILAALIAAFSAFGAGPAALVLSHIPLADTFSFAAVGPALWLLHGLVMLATLLVGPIILRSSRPPLWRAWGEYFRIVRGQPRRVMAVVAVAVAAQCLLWWLLVLCIYLAAGASSAAASSFVIAGWIAFLSYLLASLLFSLLYSFVVAALFRAVYGLPITADAGPGPAEERLEEVDPSGVRPAQRSDGTAHLADDT